MVAVVCTFILLTRAARAQNCFIAYHHTWRTLLVHNYYHSRLQLCDALHGRRLAFFGALNI